MSVAIAVIGVVLLFVLVRLIVLEKRIAEGGSR